VRFHDLYFEMNCYICADNISLSFGNVRCVAASYIFSTCFPSFRPFVLLRTGVYYVQHDDCCLIELKWGSQEIFRANIQTRVFTKSLNCVKSLVLTFQAKVSTLLLDFCFFTHRSSDIPCSYLAAFVRSMRQHLSANNRLARSSKITKLHSEQ